MKKNLVYAMAAAMVMTASFGSMTFSQGLIAHAADTEEKSEAKVDDDWDDDSWDDDYDYEADIEKAVKDGRITEAQKETLMNYYLQEESIDALLESAWAESGLSDKRDDVFDEMDKLDETIFDIEDKIPEKSWEAYDSDEFQKSVLSDEEIEKLKAGEEKIEELDQKYEALYNDNGGLKDGKEDEAEALDEKYDDVYEVLDPIYEKLYDAQMDDLIEKGVITADEKEQLNEAYNRFDTLCETLGGLEEQAINRADISDALDNMESALDEEMDEVWKLEELVWDED